MSLKFNCPKCGNEVEFKFLMVGEVGKCPKCSQDIVVPNNAIQFGDGPSEIAKDIAKKIAIKKEANIGALLIKRGLLIAFVHITLVIGLSAIYLPIVVGSHNIKHTTLPIIVYIVGIILLLPGIICIPLLMIIGQESNMTLVFLISCITYSFLGAYLLSKKR